MRRREVIAALAARRWRGRSARAAQQPGRDRAHRLPHGNRARSSPARKNLDALSQELRELGYVEGQNIVIEHRFAERDFDRLPQLVAERSG